MLYMFGKFQKVCLIVCCMLFVVQSSFAQDEGISLTETAEYDMGYTCPAASALDATGTTLWVLMFNCFSSDYVISAYNVADGSQLETYDFAAELELLANNFDTYINSMIVLADGDLLLRYYSYDFDAEEDTVTNYSLLIPVASGGEVILEASTSLDEVLGQYSIYAEFATYSPDNRLVAIAGSDGIYVIDLETETEVLAIPFPDAENSLFLLFSSDSQRLEVTQLDNFEDITGSLLIYDVSDGALLADYVLPSTVVWLSPDGKLAAVNLYSNEVGLLNELIIIDLETGLTSEAVDLDEPPAPLTNCTNSGNNVSDLGYRTTGDFYAPIFHWLPDSSGLVAAFTYGGDSAGGGSPCFFDTSRLRTYAVQIGD